MTRLETVSNVSARGCVRAVVSLQGPEGEVSSEDEKGGNYSAQQVKLP